MPGPDSQLKIRWYPARLNRRDFGTNYFCVGVRVGKVAACERSLFELEGGTCEAYIAQMPSQAVILASRGEVFNFVNIKKTHLCLFLCR
jgi:hypothetical protein